MLEDPLETFSYAFNAPEGGRSRNLIRAAYHAKDLGASIEDIIALMHEINDYMDYPLPDREFQANIINQIQRW